MSISQLQRDAFNKSITFESQVTGILLTEAKYMYYNTANLSDIEKELLSRTIMMPPGQTFARTITSDASWSITYDAWASDPEAQNGAISAGVQHDFFLITGFQPH